MAKDAGFASASLFEQLQEFAPDAIVGVSADGRIVLANAQTEALFGYAREELVGRAVETLVPEAFRRRHPEHRAAYFEDPRTRRRSSGCASRSRPATRPPRRTSAR